ncbi:MAG: ankyrin repeat domain-containing protein, partial [Chlamydiia bacterium]|nr:ankyrin repeat domain-containing protein [Chlamydiia bacterium]
QLLADKEIPIATLHTAMKLDNFEAFKVFAADPAKLNAPDKGGNTPLHLAVQMIGSSYTYYDQKYALHLIEMGADLYAENDQGMTPFDGLPDCGLDEVKQKMKEKANPQNLFQALLCNDLAKLEEFAKAEGQRNAKDASGNTPLHRAVAKTNDKAVKILCQAGADLTARNKWGQTPLDLSYTYRNPNRLLNPRYKDSIDYATEFPLHHAIISNTLGDVDSTHLNVQDTDLCFPLQRALYNENLLNKILDAKPNVHLLPLNRLTRNDFPTDATYEKYLALRLTLPTSYPQNESGFPLLYCAIDSGDLDFIEAVMKLYPPKHLLPLHYAIDCHATDNILRTLLECGADLSATDADGNTPLHLKRTAAFFEYNPPLHCKNKAGKTPLETQHILPRDTILSHPNLELHDYHHLDLLLMDLARLSTNLSSLSTEKRSRLQTAIEYLSTYEKFDEIETYSQKHEQDIAEDLKTLGISIDEVEDFQCNIQQSEILKRLKKNIVSKFLSPETIEKTRKEFKDRLLKYYTEEQLQKLKLNDTDPNYDALESLKIIQFIITYREHLKEVKEILGTEETPTLEIIREIKTIFRISPQIRHALQWGANPNLTCPALGCTTLQLATQFQDKIGSDLYSAIVLAAQLG